jgi:hypothetical protein
LLFGSPMVFCGFSLFATPSLLPSLRTYGLLAAPS